MCSINTDKNYSHLNSPIRYDFNNNASQENLHENTIEELENKILNFCNENNETNLNLQDETTIDIYMIKMKRI